MTRISGRPKIKRSFCVVSVSGCSCKRRCFNLYSIDFFYANSIWEYIFGSIVVTIALIEDSYTIIFIKISRAHIDILKERIEKRSSPLNSMEDYFRISLVALLITSGLFSKN